MEINEVNKKLYEDAFISNGEYGDLNDWKPSIDERLIEEHCEDMDGNWVPATPMGYRDYRLSRQDGLLNIFAQEAARVFTYDDAHQIKRDDNILKQYDKITIDGTNYIVTGDDENNFYVVDENDHAYFVAYLK